MNVAERIHVGFGPPYRLTYRPGPVGVVSQSGAFGNSLLMGLSAEGVGVRHYASTGNEAGLGALDLMEGMLDDPEIRAIAAYVEGFRDARPLRRIAARAAAQGVPIVLWKVGSSRAGASAAASHTANLAGDPRFYAAAFEQLGIVTAHDVGEMADCLRGVLSPRRAAPGGGRRVGVVTVSGGAGIAMADRAEELGLVLDPLAPATVAALRGRLPAFAAVANPLDVTAGALTDPDSVEAALDHVARDPNVDMIALALAAASGPAAETVATALSRLVARLPVPVAVAWNAPAEGNEAARRTLDGAGIPVLPTPGRAIRALAAIHRSGAGRAPDGGPAAAADAGQAGPLRTLDEVASKVALSGTGIRAPREAVARSAEEAVAAAREIGPPVVLKLLSAAVVHKSDIGGVRLGLSEEAEIRAAFEAIVGAGRRADPAAAPAVLVQEQIAGGIEAILGARVDPVFGPMVMVGAGGILAELVSDVAFRLAPVDEAGAREMIAGTRLARLLGGLRGRPPGDLDALAGAVAALSQRIAAPESAVAEVEINPLFVLAPGRGVVAGDCVARVGMPGGGA